MENEHTEAEEKLPQNTVSALKTIWVPRKRKENQIRNAVKRCEAALNELMEQVDFFKAEEQKILVPVETDSEIFIEDFFKLKLVGWDSYRVRGSVSFQYSDAGAGMNWRIPGNKLVRKHMNIFRKAGKQKLTASNENTTGHINGVTCSTSGSGRYFLFQENSARDYNGSSHHILADIYIQLLPQPALIYALEQGFSLSIDEDCLKENILENKNKVLQKSKQILKQINELLSEGVKIQADNKRYVFTSVEAFIEKQIEAAPNIPASEAEQKVILDYLRKQDYFRANITEYDEKLFLDPNRGSWALYDGKSEADMDSVQLKEAVYARDPRMDIQQGGVIGIDFGTKSTVVVRLTKDNEILPMRVGSGRFEKAPTAKDYENPTVMHFANVDRFLEQYRKGNGHPFTLWEDVNVSHTAYEAWNNNQDTSLYPSYFGELKQWAGTPNKRVRIRDEKGFEAELPPYAEIGAEELDPIELYAYYIGLYINNQNTGHIYMEYLLSFPVTYEMSVREHILESFRKGLMRSLPNTVLNDPECMEDFSVSEGAGEPAAYAVCALQEFGLRPEAGEKVVYGIFDFGGGTTDFDFGVWRKAEGAKERRYRYVIRHFGDGGDRYLGGENLLADLAYLVFRNNQDKLREEQITFSLPADPCCKEFPGSEYLLADSQEANSNMKQLCEKLRPFWEGESDAEADLADGSLKLLLFKRNGEKKENFELTVNTEELSAFLEKRIEQGVNEFFSALRKVSRKESLRDDVGHTKTFHFFLAGNSSKSKIVKDIFEKKIEEETEAYFETIANDKNCDPDDVKHSKEEAGQKIQLFKLYAPLGTEEAEKEISGKTGSEMERPTGKTGVAIGLVQCRHGGKIKVINEVKEGGEIKFRFSVGYEDENGYFAPLLTRDTPYGQWVEYLDAGEASFEFNYTTLPSAELEGTLSIRQTKLQRLSIPKAAVNEDHIICLRCVSPDEIEYAAAETIEKANAGNCTCEAKRIKLTEEE